MNEEKQALRAYYLQIRRSIEQQRKAELDREIARRVIRSDVYRAADAILCYVSLPHEIDTLPVLLHALQSGKRVAVPRCRSGGQMDFCRIGSLTELAAGTYGIPEPNDSCPVYVPDVQDLCIVPCLALDRSGVRLGHGGGFYDRFLAAHRVRTLCLCYSACFADALPSEATDVPMEQWISEKEV